MLQEERRQSRRAEDLIALAQKLARDSERHALLSESLAAQADRVMDAGLRLLDKLLGRRRVVPLHRRQLELGAGLVDRQQPGLDLFHELAGVVLAID